MFIAICDDEERIGAELENTLINMLGKLNIKYEIDVYFSGEALCAKLEAGAQYNLIFLDIVFAVNATNGIEVGRLIREVYRNDMVAIVYMSWEMKYSMQLFDLRPLNFLIKPLDYSKVEQVVKTYLNIAGRWSMHFTYKTGHTTRMARIKDIVYVQSDKRKLLLHLADGGKEEFYGTLKEVFTEQLQRFDFLFIHASYAVNYDYIEAVKYGEVVLVSGTTLPVSQQKRKEVREGFYSITERRRG